MIRENKLRSLLREGRPTIGVHLQTANADLLEVICLTGAVDYVEFVGQYASYDLAWLDTMGRITEMYGISSMLKVDQSLEAFLAQRAIGAGIQSILFTDIRNAEQAKASVRAVRSDTPHDQGLHGVSARRNYRYFLASSSEQIPQVHRDIVVALMIEKHGAVDDLESILSLDGVDMVNWGGGDYAFNVGRAGQRHASDIFEVERSVIEAAIGHGVPPRVELTDLDRVEHYTDLGVRHFCLNSDLRIVFDWMKTNMGRLRTILDALPGSS